MSLSLVTASYAPDFAGFERMHESLVRNSGDEVRHIVVVPDAHAELFGTIRSRRLEVRRYSAVLPRKFLQTSWIATLPGMPRGFRLAAVNAARPWPPVRGWIMQQLVKLAVVSELTTDVAVMIDSDVVVVRPLREGAFRTADGVVRLYRRPHGITEQMTRHLSQRRRALALLGLETTEVDSPDYISAFVSWDPALVRECLHRVEASTGRDWRTAVGASIDFSEYLTYGTYVMSLAEPSRRTNVGERSLCHSHWGTTALTMETAREFVETMPPDDIAVHVQSNSGTDEDVVAFIVRAASSS
ncbi:DUF6492 family protein [Microbacterium sp. NPDC058389]|uniref:DUF6492 family protein n=1 Tax=Microbacterium sp. NPDC058389 TaxID=3346475 RepID=UPI00365F57D3